MAKTKLEERAEELEVLGYDGGLPHPSLQHEKEILDLFKGKILEKSQMCNLVVACQNVIASCTKEIQS